MIFIFFITKIDYQKKNQIIFLVVLKFYKKMKRLLIFCALCILVIKSDSDTPEIDPIERIPWFVQLSINDANNIVHIGSGVYIGKNFVLTTAQNCYG